MYNGDRVGLTDTGTRALATGLRSLRRLNLSWHRNLGDAAAGALATMTALTHLDLGYCDKVPYSSVPPFQLRMRRSKQNIQYKPLLPGP